MKKDNHKFRISVIILFFIFLSSLFLYKLDEKWIIYSDWYLDCFEGALKSYLGEMKDFKSNTFKEPIYKLGSCQDLT